MDVPDVLDELPHCPLRAGRHLLVRLGANQRLGEQRGLGTQRIEVAAIAQRSHRVPFP